jgi:hypothetical protein
VTTTPDVARAEELIESLMGATWNAAKCQDAGTINAETAAFNALLSLVRDLARERDRLRTQVDVRWTKADEQIASERVRAEAAESSLSRVREQALFLVAECEGREIPFDLHDQIRALRDVARSLASSAPGDPVADPVAALQAIDEHIARTGAAPLIAPAEQPIVCPRCKIKNWDRKAAEAHARWCAAPSTGSPSSEEPTP